MEIFPKIGCCGFGMAKAKYAKRFSVVEVQQTFYEPPKISTLERWRAMMPPAFEFILKAWQLITHAASSPTYRRLKTKLNSRELRQCGAFQKSEIVQKAWETTCAGARALRARHILLQCPAKFTPTAKNVRQMRHFFNWIERHEFKLLWEPRGEWPSQLIASLCADLELVHVVDPFLAKSQTPDFVYFRLHGGRGFRQIFTKKQLENVARMIPAAAPSYVLFNNRNMLDDAAKFQNILRTTTR
jgi:uncharacterized protein YecE (DUF72 family)